MTNPGNIVRVRARRGGRASVYEANGWCQSFTDGLLDGTGVIPNTVADLNILVGGTPSCPDVVLAKNPTGYRIALDLVGQQVLAITTPATNTRVSSVIAYTDDLSLATTEDDTTGSPASCGLIVVNGAASASPIAPSDSEIRAAITADGAAGSQACYAVIADILVSSDTSTITRSLIMPRRARLAARNLDWSTFGDQKNYIDLGKIRLQWGSLRRSWGKNQTAEIALPAPFVDSDYKVFMQLKQPSGGVGSFTALDTVIISPTTTSFKLNVWNESDQTLTFTYDWFAVGLAP